MMRLAGRAVDARTGLIAAGIAVSALFMYIAVRGAHPADTLDALRDTDWAWIAPSLAVLVVAFVLRCVRWHSLFQPASRPPLRAVVGAQFVGYLANAVLPVRAGEAAAIVALNRRAGTPLAEGTATVFVQRAEDVLSMVLLLFVMLPWLPHVSWLHGAAFVAVALLVVLAVTAVLVVRFGEGAIRVLMRPLRWLPFVPADALARAPAEFVRGLAGLVTLRIAVVSFAWTTLSWVVLGVGFWLLTIGSGMDVSPLAGVLVVIAIGLAMILPSSPAALGVFEGATVVALSAYGVSDSVALSYALVLHVLNVLPLFLVAGAMLLMRRIRRREPATPTFAESVLDP